ncbi:MAG: carboxypeptidase regulatory-like domain-containing protein, partial [Lachnospiraceae bacterium]|nr:carboxypeptidase regulatory-like domain-containing protein [Lachnospiraceae bacterium]
MKAETPAYSGDLTISVTSSLGFIPIDNATVTISYSGAPDTVVQTLTTDDSGQTSTVALPAPNLSYSTEISDVQPYSEYNIAVT